MINPPLSISISIFYSFFIALRSELYIIDAILPLTLLYIHRRELKKIALHLLKVELFLFILALLVYLFENDLDTSLLILQRSILIVTTTVLIFWGRDSFFIYKGLSSLGFPTKICSMSLFATKMIELSLKELERSKETLRARCFKPKTDIKSYKVYGWLFGVVTFKILQRSNVLAQSLKARGFRGEIASKLEVGFGYKEYVVLSIVLLDFIFFLWVYSR